MKRISVATVVVVVAAGALAAWEGLGYREVVVQESGGLRMVRRDSPLRGTRYDLTEWTDHGTLIWTATIPRHGGLFRLDDAHVLVTLDAEPGSDVYAADFCGEPPFEGSEVEPESLEEGLTGYLGTRERTRRDRPLDPGDLPSPAGAGVCLVERGVGVHFCVDAAAPAMQARPGALVEGGPLVELLDAAPRVVRGLDRETGRELWRTDVPGSVFDTSLALDRAGGLAVRTGQARYALDLMTGALTRVTPEGASVCDWRDVVVALSSEGLSTTRDAPFAPSVVARPGAGRIESCSSRGGHPDATPFLLVVVTSALPAGGEIAEPVAIAEPGTPLVGGVALYSLALDGSLGAAWALPWASLAYVDSQGRLVAARGTDVAVQLIDAEGGRSLRLAVPREAPAGVPTPPE